MAGTDRGGAAHGFEQQGNQAVLTMEHTGEFSMTELEV